MGSNKGLFIYFLIILTILNNLSINKNNKKSKTIKCATLLLPSFFGLKLHHVVNSVKILIFLQSAKLVLTLINDFCSRRLGSVPQGYKPLKLNFL